jgi:hypothetical protein
MRAGTFVTHYAGKAHFDGAKDEPGVLFELARVRSCPPMQATERLSSVEQKGRVCTAPFGGFAGTTSGRPSDFAVAANRRQASTNRNTITPKAHPLALFHLGLSGPGREVTTSWACWSMVAAVPSG